MYQTLTFSRPDKAADPMARQNTTVQPIIPPHQVHILVVDDEEPLRNLLQISLQRQGYRVVTAPNGIEAIQVLQEQKVDLVLLDVMMPEMDGFTTCTELRKRSDVPIVMLTALNRPDDIVYGFTLGADDYITKPFTFREVEVRLQAILRRINWNSEPPTERLVTLGEITMNEDLHEVQVRGEIVHLTPIEFQLLRRLMSTPDRPVSKDDLFQSVWGYDLAGGTNLVEVAIRRLREKIELDPSTPAYLLTVRGAGYKFNSQGATRQLAVAD